MTFNVSDRRTVFNTKAELQNAVKCWVSDKNTAVEQFGHIKHWDVSQVTDMSRLFQYMQDFNDPINDWDVSNVEKMDIMFDEENMAMDFPSWYC